MFAKATKTTTTTAQETTTTTITKTVVIIHRKRLYQSLSVVWATIKKTPSGAPGEVPWAPFCTPWFLAWPSGTLALFPAVSRAPQYSDFAIKTHLVLRIPVGSKMTKRRSGMRKGPPGPPQGPLHD